MSVSIQTVEFERREAHLSELEDGPPFTVHGVALGADDVTVGQSGIKKLWPAEELEKAAESLQGRSLVVDHDNDASGVVGEVTKAGYKENAGVIYQAELFDEDLAEKIDHGLLEVSIRGKHTDVEQMEETDEGAKVVEDITFDNLSIVPTGAAPSNTLEMGETDELSVSELAAFTAELQEITPGMWVTTGDTNGITISQVQDGEIEVDIYEEQDGQWRSTRETEMFDVDSLSEWDVDEEDIGPVEDDEDEEEAAGISSIPDNLRFTSEEDAMAFIEDEEGLTGVHQMDGEWVPGADHQEFLDWNRERTTEEIASLIKEGQMFFSTVNNTDIIVESVDGNVATVSPVDGEDSWKENVDDIVEKVAEGDWEHSGHRDTEEMAAQGDKVQWDSAGGLARGVIVDRQVEGCFEDRIDGDVKVCADEDDPVLLINVVQEDDDGYEKSGQMVAHKESTVEQTDFSLSKHKMDPEVEDDKESEQVDAPVWEEGQLVQWQVEPQLFGKIVHVDQKRHIVMVEIHERVDGNLESTGFTISAGFSDIKPLNTDEAEMAESKTFDDYPVAASENAQMALDAREDTGNPNDCGTDVGWKRANQLANKESLSRDVVAKMSAFNRHRQNSEMDDDEGRADCGWMMWKAWGGDEGVDWAMRKMDKLEEMSEMLSVAELQAMHEPEWDSAEDKEWNQPDLEDFTDESWEDMSGDEREAIANHFLVSKTGEFPPERFSDLALPVVEPDGTLNLNALTAAKARAGQVEEVSQEDEEQLNEMINQLANENFEDATFGNDEEEATHPEGSEKPITSEADKKENREQSPERFPDDVDELQDWESHSVDFSGTTTESWDSPDMEDFDTDDLSEIDDHFLISATGFPPENFTDLALPVVEPNGDLNLNALQAAKGGRGVSAVEGLNDEMESQVSEMINGLANDNFEDAEFGEEAAAGRRPRTPDDAGMEANVQDDGPVDIALDLINKYLTIEGNHERDSVDNMLSWLMGSVDLPIETLGDFRMAARRFLDETPGTDSFDGMTVEQFRDWLLMHGHESKGRREQDQRGELPPGEPTPVTVLTGDDLRQTVDKSEESELDDITTKVFNMTEEIEQKLAELSEPVAVEQSDLDELQQKADRFEEMSSTLESLKERTDILDNVDRDQVEELADSEEPVVVESARMESLEGEAEQVAEVYAAELAGEFAAFGADELADRFSIEELREKYEEQFGDPAEELASSESAEPRSGDVEEEELEERAEEDTETEELAESEEAEQKREELRNKILG